MNYKSLLEITCEAALHHLKDAERTGRNERVAVAREELLRKLELIKDVSPELYERYSKDALICMPSDLNQNGAAE